MAVSLRSSIAKRRSHLNAALGIKRCISLKVGECCVKCLFL
ncbi:hypothetical protein VCHA34P121_70212 [Vibrio chagasii]|nr:hypothetical protein VCHA34P121_70212 [Vibrio chagasii]